MASPVYELPAGTGNVNDEYTSILRTCSSDEGVTRLRLRQGTGLGMVTMKAGVKAYVVGWEAGVRTGVKAWARAGVEAVGGGSA